jgi:Spy/CpxP family protein refolding chaperone
MKRDWLLYLVIFSLALNLGTIGTFAYLRYQDRRQAAARVEREMPPPLPVGEMWRHLNLDQEQRQHLGRLMPEHLQRVRTLRAELAAKRQELFTLLRTEEPPAWPAIQAKIREISELQGKLEEEVIRHLLEVRNQLKPEQKAAFAHLLEQRWRLFQERHGPMGARRGRHAPEMRRGPGSECPPPHPPPIPPESR